MEKPIVSVIMPVYNGRQYIRQAVDSVYIQDVPLRKSVPYRRLLLHNSINCSSVVVRPYLKYRLSEGGKSRNKKKSALMTWRVYRYMGFGGG